MKISGTTNSIGDVQTGGGSAYLLTKTSNTTITIQPNNTVWISGKPTSVDITLGNPLVDLESEYRVTFTSGSTMALTVTAPTGYTVVYPDGVPTFEADKLYELSFMVIDQYTISCLYTSVTEYPKVHNTTYLYYLGDECIDITGLWNMAGNWMPAKQSNHILFDKQSNNYLARGKALTTNQIDKADFTSFVAYASGYIYNGSNYFNAFRLRIAPDSDGPLLFSAPNTSGYFNIGSNETEKRILINEYINEENLLGVEVTTFQYVSDRTRIRMYMFCLCKQDNLQGLSAYGTDIATIISNASSLLADHNAVVYMLNNCTGDFMWSALADSTFVSTLRTSPYYSEIMADEDWNKALALLEV